MLKKWGSGRLLGSATTADVLAGPSAVAFEANSDRKAGWDQICVRHGVF